MTTRERIAQWAMFVCIVSCALTLVSIGAGLQMKRDSAESAKVKEQAASQPADVSVAEPASLPVRCRIILRWQ